VTTETNDSIQKTRRQPVSISGKAFALPFIVVLVFLVYLMFAVAVRFQTIMARLEEVRSLWPNASKELVPRYERLSSIVANAPVPESIKKEWETGCKEFGVSSQFDRQSVASLQIESQWRRAAIDSISADSVGSSSDFSLPGVSKLIEAESHRKSAQNGAIGWLTIQGLRLKLPPIYEPLAKNR
jgi:Na+-transporting methylmalonyl-CoA/oxaloacetate decarboxylase gamma subunit